MKGAPRVTLIGCAPCWSNAVRPQRKDYDVPYFPNNSTQGSPFCVVIDIEPPQMEKRYDEKEHKRLLEQIGIYSIPF